MREKFLLVILFELMRHKKLKLLLTKNPTQEEYGPTKELVRTCEEDVELAKCEGSCVSSTQPSAMERWENDDHDGLCEDDTNEALNHLPWKGGRMMQGWC